MNNRNESGWMRRGEWLSVPYSPKEEPETVMARCGIPGKLIARYMNRNGLIRKNNQLLIRAFPEEPLQCMPEWLPAEPLFEDDFCLVMYKPAGMKVHPTADGEGGTLDNAVAFHYESTGQPCKVRHIHRLDEDTTGPVLYAKNEWAHISLDDAMAAKRAARTYIAIAEGTFAEAEGTIDAPIGRDRHHASRRRVSQTGDRAVTRYEVVDQYKTAALVRLHLETGRTHQIRVHLSHLGHPLVGDTLYGGSGKLLDRQALHGERLVFPHPFRGERVEVEAVWPEDLIKLQDALKKM